MTQYTACKSLIARFASATSADAAIYAKAADCALAQGWAEVAATLHTMAAELAN